MTSCGELRLPFILLEVVGNQWTISIPHEEEIEQVVICKGLCLYLEKVENGI